MPRRILACLIAALAGVLTPWSLVLARAASATSGGLPGLPSAPNPSPDVSQYAHTAWPAQSGLFKGTINAIAQAPDGYLWLGTDFGVFRFDGVRTSPWQARAGQQLPSSYVRTLLAARDGTVWIGTLKGLSSLKDGTLTSHPELAGYSVDSLLEDRERTVWVGAAAIPRGRLCAIGTNRVQCYGDDGRLGLGVESLYEDARGNLWVAARTGLWRWQPGPPELSTLPSPGVIDSQALLEDADGALLIATPAGLRQLVDRKAALFPLPGEDSRPLTPRRLLQDRHAGLWIGTEDRGLLHVHDGQTDVFAHADGLSGDLITALFEDREGSIWVASTEGLDRFSPFVVSTISVKQGLSATAVSVLAARDGSVWVGTGDGLNRWSHGQVTIYRKPTLQAATGSDTQHRQINGRAVTNQSRRLVAAREIADAGLPDDVVDYLWEDADGRIWVVTRRGVACYENGRFMTVSGGPDTFVHAIAGDEGRNLWISQDQGLLHLRQGTVVEQIPRAALAHKDHASALVVDPVHGGLWLGFPKGDVEYVKDGQSRASFTVTDGLGEGPVTGFQFDHDGTLWVATQGGLSRVKDNRVITLTRESGLPCDSVHWVMADDANALWLGTACGLVQLARNDLDGWAATAATNPIRQIHATVFDDSDGVRSRANAAGYGPRVSRDPDGKLWFLSGGGFGVIDPRHPPVNTLPPPVQIEQITADRRTYDTSAPVRLPPRVRDLEIDFTALSLVAPDKNRFRVMLEGRDREWQDVGNRRQAIYTDLAPRAYRFRVVAANNSGVWNEAGAVLDFTVAPAYFETLWFRAIAVVAAMALVWAFYRSHHRRVAHEFDLRLEERVNERTRVARELHDTLLQTFHGVLFRFQAAVNMLPDRPAEAKENFESAIDRAAKAITEGRDAIQDLRASTVVANDLAVAITTLGDELAGSGENANGTVVDVAVQGTPRDLHPILRDDIYRIVGEALRNAFRHAEARRIEVAITYDDRQFRLQVRDDGKGIDPAVLAGERRGHFGLPGVRERAELVGGRLEVWSEVGAGTEVDLRIPASKAYAPVPARRRAWWFTKKAGTDA